MNLRKYRSSILHIIIFVFLPLCGSVCGIEIDDAPIDNVTNSMYRLADCIKFYRSENGRAVARNFPKSLCGYFHQWVKANAFQKYRRHDITKAFCARAKEYVDSHSITPLGDINTLVIHLRLGDVVSDTSVTVTELWSRPMPFYNVSKWIGFRWNYYVRSGYFFGQIPEGIPPNIRTIHLVGNIAHASSVNVTKNLEYLNKIIDLFLSRQYNVKVEVFPKDSNNVEVVDSDFLAMMTSSHFVRTGGGFGSFVQHCNILNGYGKKYEFTDCCTASGKALAELKV
eukprot:m.105541 g.105541  ORF g.105541 m.105541 type:complete len:283 (+) comp16873_c0_seq4:399-1247(+)